MTGPAMRVASSEAMKEDKLVNPTALTEKLYGGAPNICERVMEIPTSHEIQVVKRSVAQSTAGDASIMKGRKMVLIRETLLTYPLYGIISFAQVIGFSSDCGLVGV